MKLYFFLAIAVLFTILILPPRVFGEDFQSPSSHYNQYSPDNLNRSYNQYESQYSASNVSNPYSRTEVQFSAKGVIDPFAQEAHDYKAHLVSPEARAKAQKSAKKSAKDKAVAKFLEGPTTRRIPVFFLLPVISCLALGATIFIIIGVFKK